MKPLPKCAGKVDRVMAAKGNIIIAETETGRWTLIAGLWHHAKPAATMPHADSDPAGPESGAER